MTENLIFSMGRGVSSPAQGRPEPSLHERADAKHFWTSVHETLALRSEDMLEAEPKTESSPILLSSSENQDASVELTSITDNCIGKIEFSEAANRHGLDPSEPVMKSVTLALAGSTQELEHPDVTQASPNSSIRMKLREGEVSFGEANTVGSAMRDPITFSDTGSDVSLGPDRKENSIAEGGSKEIIPAGRNLRSFQVDFNENLAHINSPIGIIRVHQDNQTTLLSNVISENAEGAVPNDRLKVDGFKRRGLLKGFFDHCNTQEEKTSSGDTPNLERQNLRSASLYISGPTKNTFNNNPGYSARSLMDLVPNSVSENHVIMYNKRQYISAITPSVDFETEPEILASKEIIPALSSVNINTSVSHSQARYNFPLKMSTHSLAHGNENLSNDRSFDFNVRSTNTDLDINFNATNRDVFDALSRHQSDLRQFLKGYGVDEFSLKFDLSDGQESSEFHEPGSNQDDQTMIFVDLEENGKIEKFLVTGLDRRI